jgi:glycosyltransferase involved in cell wall biosynthesis
MLSHPHKVDPDLVTEGTPDVMPMPTAATPKVSIIVGDLSARGAGRWGGAVRPFLLDKALKKLGFKVEILGFTDTLQPLSLGADVVIKPFAQTIYPQFFGSITQLIRHIEGDLIYAYKTKASSFGIGLIARTWLKRPLILDIDDWEMSWHGGDRWRYQPSLKQRCRDLIKPDGALRQPDHPVYLQWMERLITKADAVTVHTRFLQRRFGGVYVPNGKDTDMFDPARCDRAASRQRYGLDDYRILMFPGAPRPYKGVEDVLQALDLIGEPDIKLVIVGGSPYDDYDQKLTRQWGHHIIQLPKIPHDQMPDVIAAADVIVVPQHDTPAAQAQFPLKITDGMAMAKPILATQVGDIPSILADTGYLVPARNPAAIARQLRQIFVDIEQAHQRGYQARQRCIHDYSIDTMAQLLNTVTQPLLQSCSVT